MVLLQNNSNEFEIRAGGGGGCQNKKRSSGENYLKVYFWVPMHKKSILGIMWGQNQVKVTKGHQVKIIKKSIFELLCTEKRFWASCEVKIRSRSANVIKCKFSKSVFLSSYKHKKHFKHHGMSKSGQGRPRLSIANFPSVFWSSYSQKCISDIMGGQHRVKATKGHQVQIFKK